MAYESFATNLVSGDNNGNWDIFVTLTQVALTSRVSVSTGGTEATGASHHPVMSGDGRFIAFDSEATDLVFGDNNFKTDVFVRDTLNNTTLRVTYSSTGAEGNDNSSKPSISDNGRFVTYESAASNLVSTDGNSKADAFVRDTWLGITLRASLASDGTEGNNGSV
ncbi:hypothetical protein EG829_24260, partial [bacterium]|nr:hypothetical protein [bacterium]